MTLEGGGQAAEDIGQASGLDERGGFRSHHQYSRHKRYDSGGSRFLTVVARKLSRAVRVTKRVRLAPRGERPTTSWLQALSSPTWIIGYDLRQRTCGWKPGLRIRFDLRVR